MYPNKFIQRGDTDRFYILNTLFNLPGKKTKQKAECENMISTLIYHFRVFKVSQSQS